MSFQSLEHAWPTTGKTIGSVSAHIFTSEDGKPDGKWKMSSIYGASVTSKKGKNPLVTGYVESVPGKYVGIVLSWRSSTDKLTTAWRNEEDLLAYYYIDGRPNPVMEYSILQPGAKNPLPLSGLWKSDDERFPLRWKRRPNATHGAKVPDDSIYQPAYQNSSYPYPHALATVDDLCSIRIAIHDKDAEAAASKNGNKKPAIVPNRNRLPNDPRLFQHAMLSEALDIEAPKSEKISVINSLLNTQNDIPKSTPLLEFRIYYKSRPILQDLQLLPPSSSDTKPVVTATRKASSSSLQPSNPSLSQHNHTATTRSAENAELAEAPPAKRVKREESEKETDNYAGQSRDVNLQESFDLPPPLASSSVTLAGQKLPSATSTSTQQIPPHSVAQARSQPIPHKQASHTPALRDSPAVNSPAVGNTSLSQSTGGSDRKSQARAFLCELQLLDLDDEDVEETEEMVQALLGAGFSKKQRFLNNMKACDQATREGIFQELRTSMGALNFGVLLAYLKQNCGFE